MAEASLFNGDEPEHPDQWPLLRRFGDSWAFRLTLQPLRVLELAVSRASVKSPEFRAGLGTNQSKWNALARFEGRLGSLPLYGMVEWARTEEAEGFFVFRSTLAEGMIRPGRHRIYYRLERTERPEEERLGERFRTLRPHIDSSILGVSRWTIHTLGYGIDLGSRSGPLGIRPFIEGSLVSIAKASKGIFDPQTYYGEGRKTSLTVGLEVGWKSAEHRMGRYGVLSSSDGSSHHHQMPGMND